jgi:hypothetical protein
MNKVLLCPERQRQLPSQFSWIDQRLARHRWFEQASAAAWALYLFLLTVADAQGLSYYADRTLCQRLGWSPSALSAAREELLGLGLIAYRAPLSQVLALDRLPRNAPASAPSATPRVLGNRQQARAHLQQLRQQLQSRRMP